MTAKIILKKTGKIVVYILGLVLLILIAAIVFLNTNYAKNHIRNKLESYLQNKIKTKVEIGSIDYSFPQSIEINNVYIEDLQKDTLLYAGRLYINLNMLKLIISEIDIRKVELTNIKANISRTETDSNYNFQFIINAFSGNKTEKKTTDTAAMKISLNEFVVNDFSLQYKDKYDGNDFYTTIKNLDITMDKFQPDRIEFAINQLKTAGVDFTMVSYKPAHVAAFDKNDTSKNNLQLSAKQFNLDDINVSMNNEINGMLYGNHFQHLALSNATIDMTINKASFNTIVIDSSSIKFVAPKSQQNDLVKDTAKSSAGASWVVSLKSLQMNNDEIQFDNNELPKQKEGLDPAHIIAKNIKINTGDILYSTDSITAVINQLTFNEKSGFAIDTTHALIFYSDKRFSAAELYLKTPRSVIQNSVKLNYNDISQITAYPEKTIIALKLSNTTIAINDVYTLMPSVKKYMPEEKFRDNVVNINTQVNGTLKQLIIPFFQLKGLSGSSINAKAVLYNVTDSEKLGYDIYVYNSHILKSDMIKFLPANKNIDQLPAVLDFSTHIKGDLNNTVTDIRFNSTLLTFHGKANMENIKNPGKLKYDLTIDQGIVKKSFIIALLPPNTLPESIQLPDVISLIGAVKGDMNNIEPNLILDGSYGTISVKGYVHNFKDKEKAQYDLHLTTNNFAVGKLLKQDSVFENVNMTATAKGSGFNYKTMHSSFTATIQNVSIMNYLYKDINIDADLNAGQVSSKGSINVPDLQLHYNISANLSAKYPIDVNAIINLDTIQLQKLGFYKDTLNASFIASIKAADLDPKNLNATLLIDSTKLNVRNKPYRLDSINAIATSLEGNHTIVLHSPFADASAKGAFDYDKIGQSATQYINRYYKITSASSENIDAQQIAFTGVIKGHPMLADLLPTLAFDSIPFKGSYSSSGGDSALNLHITVPKLTYQTYIVDNGKFDITSLNNEINYGLTFERLHLSKNIFYGTSIKGDMANDSLNITLITKNEKNKDRFVIGAAITNKDNNYTILLKNDLLLNYQKWNVSPDNKISYSPQGIIVKDFSIINKKEKVSANSQENIINNPIDIDIENFEIKDIASMANSDTLLASGIINGKINISNFEKKLPAFTGDLTIDTFQFMQQLVGNIKFTAKDEDENTITASLGLTGNGNLVTAKGNYYLNNDQNQFDADLNIQKLSMATLQAFTANNITRSAGSVNGDLKLSGNFSEPKWNGSLNFDSAKFTIAKTGTAYIIDKQKIALNYPSVNFSKFVIKDSAGNEMTIDGGITAHSLMGYDFLLTVNSKNFTLVNTPKVIDNQVYGYAAVDADIAVSGNITSPSIEGNISLSDKSKVTIVLPDQNIDKDASKSVVRFIDRDTFALPEKVAFAPAIEQSPDIAQFLNYNLNIKINKNAALTIIVDPSGGDELKVQGDAELNAGVDPGGNIVLAGNYTLKSGYYILSTKFLKRKFNLLDGSTIAFSGSPMDAQINITAEYIANVPPIDLLQSETGAINPQTANTYNQKIPFRVLLYLKGAMQKPEITFDIKLPDESANVAISSDMQTLIENKLAQMRSDAAVTNKEVFSLLLLGHFVGEQSSDFFQSNGTSTDEIARESVSKFLSSALNQITADLFKGIDVDLNLNSYQDYSTGDAQQKTDLDLAVSKNFLDNRLTVTAGKNFGVAGQDAAATAVQQTSSSFPDITLNYKLSKDGKYIFKAYKKDQFEVMVDGFVEETGVGFVFTLNYDKLKELFQKNNKEEKKSSK